MKQPSLDALALLFDQLAAAERAGMRLADALEIIRRDHEFGRRGEVFDALASAVGGGSPLSEAMQRAPEAFPAETVALVRGAEGAGKLAGALDLLADDYERRAAARLGFGAALVYPSLLAALIVVLVLALLMFVVPAFKLVYTNFGADLPGPTLALLSLGDFMNDFWWLWLPLLVAAIVVVCLRRRIAPAARFLDRVALITPALRSYLLKQFAARAAATLERALDSGLAVADAVAHLRATTPNGLIAARLRALEERLRAGEALPEAVRAVRELPPRLALIIELGSRTGSIAGALRHSVSMSDADAGRSLARLQRTFTLASYVTFGLVVGFTVLAVYLPIFKLGQAV
jgi:type IV pilus assembly protein PilC